VNTPGLYGGKAPENIPRIVIKNLDFAYEGKPLFKDLNLDLNGENPLVILGPSGCGKTTLLKLMGGLLSPGAGSLEMIVPGPAGAASSARAASGAGAASTAAAASGRAASPTRAASGAAGAGPANAGACSFVFQEPRLLPWKTILANVTLPAEPVLGKAEAEKRARHFLRQVSLEEKAAAYPAELSGGQKQRASFARAFAFPGAVILLDEPFQSLDIPLRILLMDMTRSLLEESPRLAVIVTHDPREAVYLGRRVVVLGKAPGGIVFDETVAGAGKPVFGSQSPGGLEKRLIGVLTSLQNATLS
jgi:NitT/TauT family transport system ATP-binding protein